MADGAMVCDFGMLGLVRIRGSFSNFVTSQQVGIFNDMAWKKQQQCDSFKVILAIKRNL